MRKTLAFALALVACGSAFAQGVVKVDPKLGAYKQVPGVNGTLNSIGSDSLNNLMTYWVESFHKHYPGVKIQVEGKGSSTAPPALIEGTAQLGPMSREMKGEEIDKFEKKYGYKPTRIAVAIDTLAVFVHRNNPIKSLSLSEVDAIFSKTRKSGHKEIRTWGELGMKGEFSAKPISAYGRNSASGTYGYFKEHALKKGDFKDTIKEQPGSSSVVQSVGTDKFAIGYSGIGYKTSNVRAVPLADDSRYNGQAFEPTYENALNGKYPMARQLYIYVNKNPRKPLDPLTQQFLTFVLSHQGQEIVVKDGYYPMPVNMQQAELKKLK
ncbi:MAG: phosphate binding protein [Holophagaceae bacterium]|nr:phosphate binding protein [Holophagaceae bacterium]